MSTKIIIESDTDGFVETTEEDGGCALIGEASFQGATLVENGVEIPEGLTQDDGFFVRFQSWYDDPSEADEPHKLLRKLEGKRVRVTIEVLD